MIESVPIIKDLLTKGAISSLDAACSKKIYAALTSDLPTLGRIEERRPGLDWGRIWRWVASIKGRDREIIFLQNHDLLPTNERKMRRMR